MLIRGTAYGGYKPTCNCSYKPVAPLAQIDYRNIPGLLDNLKVHEKTNKEILTSILKAADLAN